MPEIVGTLILLQHFRFSFFLNACQLFTYFKKSLNFIKFYATTRRIMLTIFSYKIPIKEVNKYLAHSAYMVTKIGKVRYIEGSTSDFLRNKLTILHYLRLHKK